MAKPKSLMIIRAGLMQILKVDQFLGAGQDGILTRHEFEKHKGIK